MIFTIIIILFSLVALMTLHELGHFLLAKKFGVRVDEFGIGYPPRIWGKRFGETLYSVNLLPFGAMVKMPGRGEGEENDPKNFCRKPVWQRILIVLGGVISFWVIAAVILTFLAGINGVPTGIPDNLERGFEKAEVKIFTVAVNSPAEKAGVKMGDSIVKLKIKNETPKENKFPTGQELKIKEVDKMGEVQEFTQENLGQEVILTLKRGEQVFDVSLTPRVSPPEGEGAIGVGLVRVADLKTSWYKAPLTGAKITLGQTKAIPLFLFDVVKKKIRGEKAMPLELVGVVGIGQMMGQSLAQGVGYFFTLVAMLSIGMALFNILPIPALDGGWLLFLIIEGIRKKPLPAKVEQGITAVFFSGLLLLMAIVTVKDIMRLF